jgi:3',5'-cyclic AMP phosphodiesterase CpdA
VEVEDLRALELRLVGEPRGLVPAICLEIRRFYRHPSLKVPASPDVGGTLASAPFIGTDDGGVSSFRVAHISDLHCGDPHFAPHLLERAIAEVNELGVQAVVCSGDLTAFGFKEEYAQARRYLDRLECQTLLVVPGNHDSRNVGYLHFEELFGRRDPVVHLDGVSIVGIDSSEPDLDHGHIGRSRYAWIAEQFAQPAGFRIFVLHHHLLPVPGTGRERNVVYDAGDALEALQRARVNLVLSGHKHVPYAWRLENLFVVNAGTVSTLRLRGNTRPCYNVVEIRGRSVEVWRAVPYHGRERIISFRADTLEFVKSTGHIEEEVLGG